MEWFSKRGKSVQFEGTVVHYRSFFCVSYTFQKYWVCCFLFLKFCYCFMFLPPNFCAIEDLISYCICGENEKSMKTHQKIQSFTNIIIILVFLVFSDSYGKSHERACSSWKQFTDFVSIYTASIETALEAIYHS